MHSKSTEAFPRKAILLGVAAVTIVAAAAAIYASAGAAGAAREVAGARQRLQEDRQLAGEYRSSASEALAISADIDDARSATWLQEALRRRGITNPAIKTGDPKPTPGAYDRVDTDISFGSARLEAVVAFMRDVEVERANLALTGASIARRDYAPDSWEVRLNYMALLPRP